MNNDTQNDSATMSVARAAQYFGMSEAWMRKQVFRRAIPFFKIGRAVRLQRADLDSYLDSHRVRVKDDSEADRQCDS
jgi:excisionase family DNA binding protein